MINQGIPYAKAKARLDEMVETQRLKYDEAAAQSARRVGEDTLNVMFNPASAAPIFLGQSDHRNRSEDGLTLHRVESMENSERCAEAFCENYNLQNNSCTQCLHLTIGAAMELQKLATDALHSLAAWFTSDPGGSGPMGDTHAVGDEGSVINRSTTQFDEFDAAMVVVAYATTRPGERWVMSAGRAGDALADLAQRVADDARCDLAADPFAKNLQRYRFNPGEDCIAKMAELAGCKRKAIEQKISSTPPDWKIGELFPVALGNHVVFLKVCGEHIAALYKKYEVDFKACEIVNPWEGLGNYW